MIFVVVKRVCDNRISFFRHRVTSTQRVINLILVVPIFDVIVVMLSQFDEKRVSENASTWCVID